MITFYNIANNNEQFDILDSLFKKTPEGEYVSNLSIATPYLDAYKKFIQYVDESWAEEHPDADEYETWKDKKKYKRNMYFKIKAIHKLLDNSNVI